jgi:hypothetical protein
MLHSCYDIPVNFLRAEVCIQLRPYLTGLGRLHGTSGVTPPRALRRFYVNLTEGHPSTYRAFQNSRRGRTMFGHDVRRNAAYKKLARSFA